MGMKERLLRFRSFWIFPALSIALLWTTYRAETHNLYGLAGFVAIGLIAWTLLEYVFHRFLLHLEIRSKTLRALINESHIRHHRSPRDPNQILVYPGFGIVISAMIYALLLAFTRDPFATAGIISGIWAGFLYYEAVHYRVHMSLANSPILQQRGGHTSTIISQTRKSALA
jgi:small-conductance mechanosensitive channel